MANTTFSGPVRSEHGFQVATKNNTTGTITTRYSSGMPDLTGLILTDLATGANITLINNSLNVTNYTGAAAAAIALPAATAGSVCVYVQSKTTAGGTATLTFDAVGSDVWATGSVIESRAASEVTFDIAAASETKLVFTPANAATNVLTTGGKIAFICYDEGIWNIATEFTGATAAVTGALAFAA
tara:strand:- start:350 stop:904 length:555 start_codon:yes stop_codon:yes gene_type:complete